MILNWLAFSSSPSFFTNLRQTCCDSIPLFSYQALLHWCDARQEISQFRYQTEKRTQNPQVSDMRYEIVATIIKFCPIVNVNLGLAELSRCYK